MSKIYEALQRAEQERLAGLTDEAERVEVLSLPEAAAVVEMPTEARTVRTEAPPVDGFEMGAVSVKEWKPLLDKLPALQLRGGPVEQFRSLRSRLTAFRGLNKLKTIMVTSGLPREGKSFVTANLAISFARHKSSRVLLIDGDMRRSSLHKLLGCSNTLGLATYLAGKATAVEVMQRAAPNADGSPLFAGLGPLTFIAGGDEGDKAADLSGSARFRELIHAAEPFFDWILVDSSPVNLVADGVNLAQSCDGVLLVVRGGVTRFPAAQKALGELKQSKLLGVVLNAVPTPSAEEGYYGYEAAEELPETVNA